MNTRPEMIVARLFLLLLLVALAGCADSEQIDTVYGRRSGIDGAASVNGTAVFARMFEKAGFRVSTWNRLSPRLNEYDVIVWAPDNFKPPTWQQRRFLRRWLWQGENRTLIYIGRDYDAAVTYWEKIRQTAPPTQVGEINRRLAEARAEYDAARSEIPAEQFCEWFTVRRDGEARDVRSLSGSLSEGIDASRVEIELRARFDLPQPDDVTRAVNNEETNDLEIFDPWEDHLPVDDEFDPEDVIPDEIDTLLRSGDDPLVTRITGPSYHEGNQIIVVTNGSFLLNLPLINREHRKLAGRLIADCGPPRKAAFLESNAVGPPILDEEPGTGMPTGLEALIVWPIGCILMHLAVVGILYCFAGYPIFGRPQQLPPDAPTDFRKHADALGDLLQRTNDTGYAMERLAQYQQTVRGESASARGGRFRAAAAKRESFNAQPQAPATGSQPPEPASAQPEAR